MPEIKTAIVQCADTGPLESLALMFQAVGIRTAVPNRTLKSLLRAAGCDTVLDIDSLVRGWGYEPPNLGGAPFPEAGPADMARTDVLYVDVKGHRNGPLVWKKWPHLERRTLWYRINGGKPEHCVNESGDHGDEVNPPCPVLTPNQWYRNFGEPEVQPDGTVINFPHPVRALYREGKSYCMWPPYYRFGEHPPRGINPSGYPVCFVHNVNGWGYRDLVDPVRKLGVKVYGHGSPDGLVPHTQVKDILQGCRAYVHLKSNDAPGYALYEALSSACPVIVPRRLIWRCRMGELLVPGVTCLTFDRETHDPLSPEDVTGCTQRIAGHLENLCNPDYNRQIGEAGRERLRQIMWSESRASDMESLRHFLSVNFGAVR